ncbi:CACTIN, partial [Cordylochernes scorpioides]
MTRSFKVLQANLRKSPSAVLELSSIAAEQRIDAILLQELPKNFKWPDSNFVTFIPNDNYTPAGLVIRADLNPIPLSSNDPNIVTALIRLGSQAVVIASAYWHNSASENTFLPTLEHTLNRTPFPCILGMDANAHSPTWGSGAVRDTRGASLEASASLMGLHFLGGPTPYTWSNGALRSSIDVTLASSSLAINATRVCLQDMAFSDHLPILTNFSNILPSEPTSSWVESSCLEAAFAAFLGNTLHHVASRLQTALTPGDIDEAVILLTTCLQEACDASMKKKSKSPRSSKPWWNKEVSKLRNIVVALRRCSQNTFFPTRSFFKGLYRACHNKLKAAIRRAKRLSWISLCQEVSSAAWSSIHRYISKGWRGSLGPPLLKHKDGTPLTSEETCREVLQNYFPTDWTVPRPTVDWLPTFNQEPAFTAAEIFRAIRRCGWRKSPGPDRLGVSTIREQYGLSYISAEEGDLTVEMNEPYIYLNGLSISDLEDLQEDIRVYKELENGRNQDYWKDLEIIAEDELHKLRKKDDQALHAHIEAKIRAEDEGVEIGYWETLLSRLRAFMARARLRQRHQDNLHRKLLQLKKEQGVETGPLFPCAKTIDPKPSTSTQPPQAVKEDLPPPAPSKEPTPPAQPQPQDPPSPQPGPSTAPPDEEEMETSVTQEEAEYETGGYSPRLIPLSSLEPGTLLTDSEEDWKHLLFQRSQLLGTGKVENELTKEEQAFEREARKGMVDDEASFSVESPLDKTYLWSDKYRPRKPRYFNRVHTGFEWNKYNQTHYDLDNPPPKIVQGYKFNIFYPDLIDKSITPQFFLEPCADNKDFAILSDDVHSDKEEHVIIRNYKPEYKNKNNIFIEIKDVENIISKLNIKKAPGPDFISNNMIKHAEWPGHLPLSHLLIEAPTGRNTNITPATDPQLQLLHPHLPQTPSTITRDTERKIKNIGTEDPQLQLLHPHLPQTPSTITRDTERKIKNIGTEDPQLQLLHPHLPQTPSTITRDTERKIKNIGTEDPQLQLLHPHLPQTPSTVTGDTERGIKKHRNRSRSPRETSQARLKRIRLEQLKEKMELKRQKDLMKQMETPGQKRLRRLAKKEAKERKKKKDMGRDEEYMGYTNTDNPFGEANLLKPFAWSKKMEKEGLVSLTEEAIEKRNKKILEANKRELEKVKRRRLERERERESRDEELTRIQREKEAAQFKEWEKQEDIFHLQQAILRSKIRIVDGRAKAIDLLARYISAEEGDLTVEMNEPYIYLNGLSISDLEDLQEDIRVYKELENGRNQDYWKYLEIIAEDELHKLRKKNDQVGRRDAINPAVARDVVGIFRGRGPEELEALHAHIEAKIRAEDEGVDIGYWETLLSRLRAFMARARLRQRHQDNLHRKLLQLKKEQGVETGPLFPCAKTIDPKPSTSTQPPQAVKEDLPPPAPSKEPTPPAQPQPQDPPSPQPGPSTAPPDEEEMETSVTQEEAEYETGGYSPRLIPLSSLEPGTLLTDSEEDWKRLLFQRSQLLGTGKVENELTKEEQAFEREARKGMVDDEASFSVESPLDKTYLWSDKYRPRKPRYFNRVHTGFEWNKYNQTHYDLDNPPPKIVQGYKFNIFYPDLIDKSITPQFFLEPCADNKDFAILRFHAGPPCEDIAFKIVNREWEYSYKRDYRCQFYNNIFQLWFHFKIYRYRLSHSALKIQEYDFEIIYKSGKKHLDADGLSRGPLPETDFDDNYDSLFFNPVIEDSDEYIENIKRCLGDTEGKRSIVENFKEENGCLYKRNPRPEGRAWLLVVPRVRRKDILKEHHNHMICGHLGVTRTMHRLKDKYFWPSMLKDVVEYVRTCHLCQSRKGSNQLSAGLLHPIPAANYPFERVGIDFLGPLPSTKNRKKWMIVLTDYYTKYAETKAVIDATAREVAKFLTENVILKHGAPRYLISDRGSQFTSNLVKEITKICQIQHCLTTSYHPQTNGLTERLNRTLINMISMYVNVDQRNWDEILPFITHAYNTTIQETTKYSPFFLLYGREPVSILDDTNIFIEPDSEDYDEYVSKLMERIVRTRDIVKVNTEKSQAKMINYYNQKHRQTGYEPGDLVALWTPIRKPGK